MKMQRQVVLASLLSSLLVSLLTTGCRKPAATPEATPKLRIGMVTFPGYAPLYLAKQKSLFKGLDVELLRIESISDLRAAMISHKIDVYLATYDIFQSAATVTPGVAFLGIDESHGADGIAAEAGVASITDLKGKQVAAEPGFPPYFVLQYVLHTKGMTLKDIQFRDMASQDAGTAFASGKFPAVGTYEPYLTKAIKTRPNAHLLASSKDVPHLIVDFAFADETLLKTKPEVLHSFADGWFTALGYIKQHPGESMQIMGKSFGVSAQDMKDFNSVVSWLGMDENRALFDHSAAHNAYMTFDLVGTILDANGARKAKTTGSEKISDVILKRYNR